MKMLKPLGILASLGIFLGLCSCGAIKQEISIREKLVAGGTSNNDPKAVRFEKCLENEYLEFWMNPDTTSWYVLQKASGKKWYSHQEGSEPDAADQALFSLTYLNEQNLQKTMNTSEDSVAAGQYTVTVDAGAVTVRYGIGQYGAQTLVPLALTQERYDLLLESVEDEFDQGTFEAAYTYVDIGTVTDAALKSTYLRDYPALQEQPLYVVNALSVSGSSLKRLEAILQEAGYTREQYDEDSRYFLVSDGEEGVAAFGLTVIYSLDGAGLSVSIPGDQIDMTSKFPLLTLNVLPGFASPTRGDSGYYVLPDGSGALMSFYNGKDAYQPLSLKVYGDNDSLGAAEKIYDTKSVYLPYFGIKNGSHGVLAELCDGAAIATVKAYTGSALQPAGVYASYALYDTAQSTYLTEGTESYTILPTQRYQGDIALFYTFLTGQEADYNHMARLCRQRIFGEKAATRKTEIPVLVETVGCAGKEASLWGVPYRREVELTTFAQAQEIMAYFQGQGLSQLSLRFSGGFSGGYFSGPVSGNPVPLSRLGGQEGFALLTARLQETGVGFYPDFDVQYVYRTGLFDGFSAKKEAVTLVNRSPGYVYSYDPATFQKENYIRAYILNLTGIKNAFAGVGRFLEKQSLSSVSLRYVGQALNAQYKAGAVEDRQVTLDETAAQVKKLAQKRVRILTRGANAPYLNAVAACTDLPLSSSGYAMTDQDIPFLQMVLSGSVAYYGIPLNGSGDFEEALLQSAVTASGVQVRLTGCSAEQLKGLELTDLFAADNAYYRETYAAAIKAYQQQLSEVAGQEMTAYEQLAEGVYYSVFANQKAVLVNRTEQPYTDRNGRVVKAKSFAVTEVLTE